MLRTALLDELRSVQTSPGMAHTLLPCMNCCSPERDIADHRTWTVHVFPRTRLIPLLRVPGDWDFCQSLRCPCAEQGTAVERTARSHGLRDFSNPESTKGRFVSTIVLLWRENKSPLVPLRHVIRRTNQNMANLELPGPPQIA